MTDQKSFPVKAVDSLLGIFSIGGCALSFFTNQIIYLTAPLTVTLTYGLFVQRRILLHNHRIETQAAIHKVLSEYKPESAQNKNQDQIIQPIRKLAYFTKNVITENQESLATRIENGITDLEGSIREQLQGVRLTHEYFLISTRTQSRQELLKALEEVNYRMIIISPWLTKSAINQDVITEFRRVLNQGKRIEVGWGNLGRLKRRRRLTAERIIKSNPHLYNGLPLLEQLEEEFPSNLKIKCLGTHEKIWVCDFNRAYLGSHNILSSGDGSTEREIGIVSSDPYLIRSLIDVFDNAESISRNKQISIDFPSDSDPDDSEPDPNGDDDFDINNKDSDNNNSE